MAKWKTVRIKRELMAAAKRTVKKGKYSSLSEFVSEAIQLQLNEIRQSPKERMKIQIDYGAAEERLYCSSNHMWAMVTSEGKIRVGLTGYAQERLKGVLTLQTEPIGYEVHKKRPFGYIDTWMFRFGLYAPISGRITQLNKFVQDQPSKINQDPYRDGWIAEIEPSNTITLGEELRDLMSLKHYEMWAITLRHFPRAKFQCAK
ncbi:MAG: hypothetical protein JSV05_06330 [Candidatus Bathyarchaeota archaeon]|nr:MAG: hypothetical protein JSV05_06330 [Candidatus Bathyarchaeota archaeon]